MSELLTESFCERCGTRYTFESGEPEVRRVPIKKARVLARGLKNFVLSDTVSLDDALAEARHDEDRGRTALQLEAFHDTFNFCMDCRQYTCRDCWNEAEGRCLSCAPTAGTLESAIAPAVIPEADASDRLAQLFGAAGAAAGPAASPVVEPPPAELPAYAVDAASAGHGLENGVVAAPTTPETVEEAGPGALSLEAALLAAAAASPPAQAPSELDTPQEPAPPNEPAAASADEVVEPLPEPLGSVLSAPPEVEAPLAAADAAALADEPAAPAVEVPVPLQEAPAPAAETPVPLAEAPPAAAASPSPTPEPPAAPGPAAGSPPAPARPVLKPRTAPTRGRLPGWEVVAPDTPGALTGGRPLNRPMPSREVQPAPWFAARADASVWEVSTAEILDRPGSGVGSCVNCGLPLSASAHFCRRCGSRQAA